MEPGHEGVVAVLVRYARAIDTTDWRCFRSCFTDDVVADYGDIGVWQGIDGLTDFMVAAHAGMGRTQHFLSNFQTDIEGDGAVSVSYVHAVTVLASHPEDWIDTIGTYEDELIRDGDGWRIAQRTFRTTRTILSPSLSATPHRQSEPEPAS